MSIPDPTGGEASPIDRSAAFIKSVVADFQPTHIVAMVSGGRDSAAAFAAAEEIGLPVDLILHGKTGTGIPETTQHVQGYYGARGPDFAIADAGDAYERYVTRKGFFGKERQAHNYSYRILKADPFRAAISRCIRQRRRGVRVMLLNGARKSEGDNRRLNLRPTRLDKGNLWVNICHEWTSGVRDAYLAEREVPINPVAVQLCRSGECMCGTMQTNAERAEAAALYPAWGSWLNDLEATVKAKHGWGWGDTGPPYRDKRQLDMFQPMCADCEAQP
jgi:3'-phosphoadenosine 5'-phosphosulfate sulfotransferase (PAPS reductase)/FAD synthetase